MPRHGNVALTPSTLRHQQYAAYKAAHAAALYTINSGSKKDILASRDLVARYNAFMVARSTLLPTFDFKPAVFKSA